MTCCVAEFGASSAGAPPRACSSVAARAAGFLPRRRTEVCCCGIKILHNQIELWTDPMGGSFGAWTDKQSATSSGAKRPATPSGRRTRRSSSCRRSSLSHVGSGGQGGGWPWLMGVGWAGPQGTGGRGGRDRMDRTWG